MKTRNWWRIACAGPVLGWSLAVGATSTWHYTLDQARDQQQANFCAGREDVEEIAGIFTRYGPRAGYAALAGSPNCQVAVKTFTPRAVLMTITVSEGEPGEYRIHFVEVESDRGGVMYLVTTRDVVAE